MNNETIVSDRVEFDVPFEEWKQCLTALAEWMPEVDNWIVTSVFQQQSSALTDEKYFHLIAVD